jgi:Protein of unknown function (DUF2857)
MSVTPKQDAPICVPINVKTLSEQCLRFFIQSVEQQYVSAVSHGMQPLLHDRLRELSMDDTNRLHHTRPLFTLTLHQDVAQALLASLDARKKEERMLSFFVGRGATADFLRRYLHASADRIAQYRSVLAVNRRGRPPRPAVEICQAVAARWRELLDEQPRAIERYFVLAHDYPDYTMATLAAIIEDIDRLPPPTAMLPSPATRTRP